MRLTLLQPGVRDCLLKGTISRGLELLHAVFLINNHTQLVSTMQNNICWPAGSFLEGEALSEGVQSERRQAWPSPHDEKQDRRDPLPFNGDSEPDHESHPPLAWALMWGGTYSNLYGYY